MQLQHPTQILKLVTLWARQVTAVSPNIHTQFLQFCASSKHIVTAWWWISTWGLYWPCASIYEVWSKNTMNVSIKKKIITVKDTLPLIPLKILPPALNTLIPSFLPLSEAVLEVLFRECLVALSWLPRCPESIQNVYLSWSLWLWGRARSHTVPDAVNKVDEGTP